MKSIETPNKPRKLKIIFEVIFRLWIMIILTVIAISLLVIGEKLSQVEKVIRRIDSSGTESAIDDLSRTLDMRLR